MEEVELSHLSADEAMVVLSKCGGCCDDRERIDVVAVEGGRLGVGPQATEAGCSLNEEATVACRRVKDCCVPTPHRPFNQRSHD